MTNYHIINPSVENENIEIEIYNKKKMKLEFKNRYIKYIEKPKDITMIEIKESDEIYNDIIFLDYDLNCIKQRYPLYKGENVFSIQHPYGEDASCASGKIIEVNEYEFDHDISTNNGSSGCPIILLNNNINLIQVIGIHKEGDKKHNINGGTFIGEIFNKNLNTIEIKKEEIIEKENPNKESNEDIKEKKKEKNEIKEENNFLLNIVSENLGELNDLIKDVYFSIICQDCGDKFCDKIGLGKFVITNMMIENKILQNCKKCGKNNYGVDIPYNFNMKCKNCGSKYFEKDLPFSLLEMILALKGNFKDCEKCGKNDFILISEQKNE